MATVLELFASAVAECPSFQALVAAPDSQTALSQGVRYFGWDEKDEDDFEPEAGLYCWDGPMSANVVATGSTEISGSISGAFLVPVAGATESERSLAQAAFREAILGDLRDAIQAGETRILVSLSFDSPMRSSETEKNRDGYWILPFTAAWPSPFMI